MTRRASYYDTPHWRKLKGEALRRDHYRCTVPGCQETSATGRLSVDHVTPRPRGAIGPTPQDVLSNLRTLCKGHDNAVMQGADGRRRNDGQFVVRGCDISGRPLDPGHPWNQPKG